MTTRQRNNSAISRGLTRFSDWLELQAKERHGNIDATSFLTVSAVVLTLSAFLYLGAFYAYFGINYFRFFTFEDGLSVLYEKGRLFLLFPMITGFAAIAITVLHILRKKNVMEELKTNASLFFSPLIACIATGMVFWSVCGLPLKTCFLIGLLTAGIAIMYFLLDVRTLYFYPVLLGYGLVLCAKVDAKKVMEQKITFDLKMVDETEPMPIMEHQKTFWVGTTSKMIYFYNDSTRQVTEVPIEQIGRVSYTGQNLPVE